METRTLLLNSWAQPHKILNWEEAICHLYLDKANVLEEYDETISSPSMTYFLPAVMQLKNSFTPRKKGVKFSRLNVLTRDGFRCQYCNERKTMGELNYDHVLPRTQGGQTKWDNIVTSCYPCNRQKGGRTPEQARMKLLRKPAKPHSLPLHAVFISSTIIPEPWKPYIDLSRAQPHGSGLYLVGHAA